MNWEIINTVVSIIQILVSVVLIVSVLMQSAKKEGISGVIGGASETFFGKNKGRTFDSKFAVITTVCAIVFLVSSLFLSYGMLAVENNNAPQTQYEDITGGDVEVELEGETEAPAEGETETPAEETAE